MQTNCTKYVADKGAQWRAERVASCCCPTPPVCPPPLPSPTPAGRLVCQYYCDSVFVRWVHHRVPYRGPTTRAPLPHPHSYPPSPLLGQVNRRQARTKSPPAAPQAPSTGNSLVSTNRPPAYYYYVYLYLPPSKLLSYLTLSLSCSHRPSFIIINITRTAAIACSKPPSLIFLPTTFAYIFSDVPTRSPEQWLESMLMYFPFISYPPTSTPQSSWFSTLKILGRVGDRNGFVVRGGGENPPPPLLRRECANAREPFGDTGQPAYA